MLFLYRWSGRCLYIRMSIFKQIRDGIGNDFESDCFWSPYWEENALGELPKVTTHLAIFVEPFLDYILEGKKTIESRFSIRRTPPFDVARKGDIIFLKRTSGPIVGVCKAENVWHYDLDPTTLEELRNKYAVALCADDPEFWAVRADAAFATLIRISNVKPLRDIDIKKNDPRGWAVLKRKTNQLRLWDDE